MIRAERDTGGMDELSKTSLQHGFWAHHAMLRTGSRDDDSRNNEDRTTAQDCSVSHRGYSDMRQLCPEPSDAEGFRKTAARIRVEHLESWVRSKQSRQHISQKRQHSKICSDQFADVDAAGLAWAARVSNVDFKDLSDREAPRVKVQIVGYSTALALFAV